MPAELLIIMFTDLVGSTPMRFELGEEAADALQEIHDALLDDVVVAHRGTVVKGSGDGVLATFDAASDALGAAVTIQARSREYGRRRNAIAPLVMRIGLSVGDIVHQNGDVFGTAVVEAKRLEGAAEPGQILCSEMVRVLARGRGAFEFELVGMLELKGLPEPVPACIVSAPSAATVTATMPAALDSHAGGSFVGRGSEVAELVGTVRAAEGPSATWVLGEPGIGKTRLAAEVARRANQDGATVLFGRCDEGVTAPYQPVIEALRTMVRDADPEDLPAQLGSDPGPLAQLVPELSDLIDLGPATGAVDQYRLFESVREALAARAAAAPVLYVIDDIHWADPSTLAMLGHVLRSPDPFPMLVLATARDTAPDSSQSLSDLADDLARLGRSRQLDLRGLDDEDVSELLDRAGLDRGGAASLVHRTAGNPLFLAAAMAEDASGDVSHQLDHAVRRRISALPAAVQDALRVAAIIGLDFDLATLAPAADLDRSTALDRVEIAVAAGLAVETGADHFRFTHALVRDGLVAGLTKSRRRMVHRKVADVLEALPGGPSEDVYHALTQHYAYAGDDPELLRRAFRHSMRSGERAVRILAFDGAVVDFDRALALAGRIPDLDPAARIDALLARGDAQRRGSVFQEAIQSFMAAADEAEAIGDWDRLGDAAVGVDEAVWRPGLPATGAVGLLRRVVGHADRLHPTIAVRVRASLGRALRFAGVAEEARQIGEAALADAELLGDDATLSHALLASAPATYDLYGQVAHLEQRMERAWQLSDDFEQLAAIAMYGHGAAHTIGARDRVERWQTRFDDADRIGTMWTRLIVKQVRTTHTITSGDLAEARIQLAAAQRIAERFPLDSSGLLGGLEFNLRRELDELRPLRPVIERLVDSGQAEGLWAPGLVPLLVEVGLHDRARELLRAETADGCRSLPDDNLRAPVVALYTFAASDLGAVEVAPDLVEALAGWDCDLSIEAQFGYMGSARRLTGLLHELNGDVGRAIEDLLIAEAFERKLGYVLPLGHVLVDVARVLDATDRHLDAKRKAAEARSIAEDYDLPRLGRRVAELAGR